MRLGQLARKLDKKPQELVDFLGKDHQITIDVDLNTKVDKAALDLVMEAFGTDDKVEEEVSLPDEKGLDDAKTLETVENLELSEEEIEDLAAEAVMAEIEEELEPEEVAEVEKLVRVGEDGEELPELIVEDGVIKAPKPELDGPKVVGKIELPVIKRSVQFLVTNSGNTVDVTEEIFKKRKATKEVRKKRAIEAKKQRKIKQQKKRSKKVLSDAEKKAREEKVAQKRKADLEKKRQEKKKAHYFNNVQQKAAKQSAVKKKKEIERAVKKKRTPKQPEPTTLWGKFKKWLNT